MALRHPTRAFPELPMKLVLLSSLALILAILPAVAQQAAKTRVSLGTATPGGGFPVYGAALAATVNAVDATLEVVPQNTKGSAENIPLLAEEKLDIALVQGEAALAAFTGGQSANLRIISAMYATPGMFVVRADAPYRSIEDLRGKPVVFGAKGSGLVLLAGYVLDGLGLDRDRDFSAILLDSAGDGPKLVMDGKAAALWGGGVGWPGFMAVANSPTGARFIVPDAQGVARILSKHAFLKKLTVPAGSFPGQGEELVSVGSWSFVLARATLAEDVAYRLARALNIGEAALAKRLAQARETTAANTAKAAAVALLHPGVASYLREIGLLR
jgi:TRAP transporter TAXI family solute receptor